MKTLSTATLLAAALSAALSAGLAAGAQAQTVSSISGSCFVTFTETTTGGGADPFAVRSADFGCGSLPCQSASAADCAKRAFGTQNRSPGRCAAACAQWLLLQCPKRSCCHPQPVAGAGHCVWRVHAYPACARRRHAWRLLPERRQRHPPFHLTRLPLKAQTAKTPEDYSSSGVSLCGSIGIDAPCGQSPCTPK